MSLKVKGESGWPIVLGVLWEPRLSERHLRHLYPEIQSGFPIWSEFLVITSDACMQHEVFPWRLDNPL